MFYNLVNYDIKKYFLELESKNDWFGTRKQIILNSINAFKKLLQVIQLIMMVENFSI